MANRKPSQSAIENPSPGAALAGPRPTQSAIEVVSTKRTWLGVWQGMLCLLGFGVGLGVWLDPGIASSVMNASTPHSLAGSFLPFLFPIFLPMAVGIWWLTRRGWRNSQALAAGRKTTTGVITRLWIDPPRPPGRKYYVGYRYGDGHTTYQTVHARIYGRLGLAQPVTVEYVADQPHLSRLDLSQRFRKMT